jgi:hypothetical protein
MLGSRFLARPVRVLTTMATASATALVVTVPAVTVAGQPAAAGSTTCSNVSINPRRAINNYSERRGANLSGRRISLMAGNWPGSSDIYGWGEISGPTAGSDRVWMDVSKDAGSSWSQCGPFSVDVAGTIGFSRAEPADLNNNRLKFRACGDILVSGKRKLECTSWW